MKLKSILFLLIILLTSSCSTKNKTKGIKSSRVVITGKVLNFSPEHKQIKVNVNRIGFRQEQIAVPLDSQGNFSTTFESYVPTDVWITYRKHFLVLTHPGDSLYVEIDGEQKNRADILKSIKFRGNSAKSNLDALTFQRMYNLDSLNTPESVNMAMKESDVDQFCSYLDKVKQNSKMLFDDFVLNVQPNEETKIWANDFLNSVPYNRMMLYPFFHQSLNNLEYNNQIEEMPAKYYDPILKGKSITESNFISGSSVNDYVRYYIMAFKTSNHLYNTKIKGSMNTRQRNNLDSITVYGLLKSTEKEPLFTQMVLTSLFSERIEMESDIDFFEKYQEIAQKYIQEPFLRDPLFELYSKKKNQMENSQDSNSSILKKTINSSGKQILDSILVLNKGKVIYIDCWATWCGPCKAEMPNSNALIEQMHDKDVAFVFLCLQSEEKEWKSTIAKLNIGGQHYFISKKRSMDFQKAFEINGFPNYFLIDKEGNIVEKGLHLRPNIVKEKIEKLLKK